jgi:hypothetical protein
LDRYCRDIAHRPVTACINFAKPRTSHNDRA